VRLSASPVNVAETIVKLDLTPFSRSIFSLSGRKKEPLMGTKGRKMKSQEG
jgi:hypothetical protein